MAERRLARDVRHRRAEEVRVGHLRRCEIVHANEDGASKVDLADDALVRGIVGSDPSPTAKGRYRMMTSDPRTFAAASRREKATKSAPTAEKAAKMFMFACHTLRNHPRKRYAKSALSARR